MKKLTLPFKFLSTKTLDDLLARASEQGADAFFAKYKERFSPSDNSKEALWEDYDTSFEVFQSFFEKNKIKNKTVQREILNSFYDPPEIDISDSELHMIQDACWSKYATDPLISGVVDNFVDYIIGTGIKVFSPVPEVQAEIEKFRRVNKLDVREREIVKSSFLDGEFFVLGFVNSDGRTFIRKAHPKTIRSIEPCPVDIETTFSYTQEYTIMDQDGNPSGKDHTRHIPDVNYENEIKSGLWAQRSIHANKFKDKNVKGSIFCKMIKFNDFDKLRGMPPLRRVLKYSKMFENFIKDRMVLNHERSKVVWIKKIIGRAAEVTSRTRSAPRGGSILLENEGITYRTEKANLDSSEAKEDALNLLYYIGSGVRFPLHILNQRSDQAVYSSLKKADMPFAKMVASFQFFYAINFEDVYRRMISELVKAKVLKKEYSFPDYQEDSIVMAVTHYIENEGKVEQDILMAQSKAIADEGLTNKTLPTEQLPISFDFEQVILQDPKEMAEVLKIHDEMGIASKHSLSVKAGYTWKVEFARIVNYTKAMQEINPPVEDPNKDTKTPDNKKDVKTTPKKEVKK